MAQDANLKSFGIDKDKIKEAAEARASGSSGKRAETREERQARKEATAALFTEGQETELAAMEEGVLAAKTAATKGMSKAVEAQGGDPTARMGARETAAATIEAQKFAGEDIAEAELSLGEKQVQIAEERVETGDALETEAKAEAADLAATWGAEWDAIEEKHTHWYGDDEDAAYEEMINKIDATVQEVFGASFRGAEGRALANRIEDLASGRGEGTAYEKAMAKTIWDYRNKATAFKESGEGDWW